MLNGMKDGQRARPKVSKPRHVLDVGNLLLSVATFLILALLVHFGVTTERSRIKQNLRTHVSREALAHVSRLEAELNANVFLANGMVAHVVAQGGVLDESVMDAMQALRQYGRHIRNIGIAPDNRISHIYPRAGNEAALGLYYPEVPSQWPAVQRAIALRQTVLAGPVALRQGGTALISRTPVYMPDGRYWGVIGMALDMTGLFGAVGLDEQVGDIGYALRGTDGAGREGAVFMGRPELFADDAVLFDITVPGGTWQLAAAPTQGWNATDRGTALLEGSGLVLALMLSQLLYLHLRNRRRVVDSEQRLRAFLDTTKDAVIVSDDDGAVHEFNPAAERLFGYGAAEMLGRTVHALMPDHKAGASDGHGRRKDGSEFPIEVTVGAARVDGHRLHVRVIRDVTERKAIERRLLEFATVDALTGALNRRAFLEAANAALSLARRHHRPLALLMVDADHFKRINDSHGHHAGDAVLVRLTELARAVLRTTDSFGRMGGEEFAVVLPETDAGQAVEVAERLLAAVRAAEVAGDAGKTIRFTVSIGIGALSDQVEDVETLMRAADRALYRAKAEGRDRWYKVE